MLAIALGVYLVVFAVVVAVFYAASKSKPSSSTLNWEEDSPKDLDEHIEREPQEHV